MFRLSDNAAAKSPRPRVNLIFQGLLAFFDDDPSYYDVLIPRTSCRINHKAKYGNPLDCDPEDPIACLSPFLQNDDFPAPSLYRIEGVLPASPTQVSKPSAANAIILNGLDLDESNILIKIRVPKPYIIRHYRGTETHGHDITGGDHATHQCMFQAPDVVHEVIVFSYFAFNQPCLVGPNDTFKIPQRKTGPFWNLCIYAQPEGVDCDHDDSRLLAKMFVIRATGSNPKVAVNFDFGTDDRPPTQTAPGVGIDYREMLSLSELSVTPAALPGGCSGMFGGH